MMTLAPWLLIFVIESGEFHAVFRDRAECIAIASSVSKGEDISVKIDDGEAVRVVSAWCLKPEQGEVPL